MPDNNTPPASAEEIQKAKEAALAEYEKKIAEAKLKVAEANKSLKEMNNPVSAKDAAATAAAIAENNLKVQQAARDQWKSPEVKALEGKISSEGTFIESRILAAETLGKAMSKLVKKINERSPFNNGKPVTFILYNSPDFASIQLYVNMKEQLSAIRETLQKADAIAKKVLNPAIDLGLAGGAVDPLLLGYAAAGSIKSIADLLSLFKQNTSIANFDINIDDTTLVSAFVHAVHHQNKLWKVFHPAVYPVNTIIPDPGYTNDFASTMNELNLFNNSLVNSNAAIDAKLAQLQTDLAATTDAAIKAQLTKEIKTYTDAKSELSQVLPIMPQLETMLATTAAGSTNSPQALIIQGERVFNKLKEPNAYVIKLVAVSRGSNKVSENIFRPARIFHSGGSEVSCLVFEPSGNIVFSGTCTDYTPYRNADDLREYGGS